MATNGPPTFLHHGSRGDFHDETHQPHSWNILGPRKRIFVDKNLAWVDCESEKHNCSICESKQNSKSNFPAKPQMSRWHLWWTLKHIRNDSTILPRPSQYFRVTFVGLESFNKNGQNTSLLYIHFKGSRLKSYFNEYESEPTQNLHGFFLCREFTISFCWILLQWWAPHLIKSKSSEPCAKVTIQFLRDTCDRHLDGKPSLQSFKSPNYADLEHANSHRAKTGFQMLGVTSYGFGPIRKDSLGPSLPIISNTPEVWILNTGQISQRNERKTIFRAEFCECFHFWTESRYYPYKR